MPASASPRATFWTTADTDVSNDFAVTVTPAVAIAWAPYLPAGTVGFSRSTATPGFARSARVLMPFGLPLTTMIWSRFLAKMWTVDVGTRPGLVTLSMFVVSALAKTSAG